MATTRGQAESKASTATEEEPAPPKGRCYSRKGPDDRTVDSPSKSSRSNQSDSRKVRTATVGRQRQETAEGGGRHANRQAKRTRQIKPRDLREYKQRHNRHNLQSRPPRISRGRNSQSFESRHTTSGKEERQERNSRNSRSNILGNCGCQNASFKKIELRLLGQRLQSSLNSTGSTKGGSFNKDIWARHPHSALQARVGGRRLHSTGSTSVHHGVSSK
jgi:hypothetical protein